jgi:hypothetical protein
MAVQVTMAVLMMMVAPAVAALVPLLRVPLVLPVAVAVLLHLRVARVVPPAAVRAAMEERQ